MIECQILKGSAGTVHLGLDHSYAMKLLIAEIIFLPFQVC